MIRLFGNRRKRKEEEKALKEKRDWVMNQINQLPDEIFDLTVDNMIYSKRHDKKFYIHHTPYILMYVDNKINELGGTRKRWAYEYVYSTDIKYLDVGFSFSFFCATEEYNQDIGESGNIPISIFDIGRNYTILEETRQWDNDNNSSQNSDLERYMNLEDPN